MQVRTLSVKKLAVSGFRLVTLSMLKVEGKVPIITQE
jgi:hypothetical protein